jgi:hypothetical protein
MKAPIVKTCAKKQDGIIGQLTNRENNPLANCINRQYFKSLADTLDCQNAHSLSTNSLSKNKGETSCRYSPSQPHGTIHNKYDANCRPETTLPFATCWTRRRIYAQQMLTAGQPGSTRVLLFHRRRDTMKSVQEHSYPHPTAEQSPSDTRALSPQMVWWLRAGQDWISRLPEVEPPHAVLAHGLAQEGSYGLTVSSNRGRVGTVAPAVDVGGAGELFGVAAEVEVAAADEAAAAVQVDAQ